MSSLTTAGSSEEHHHSVSAEEFGAHLSLGIGGGGRRTARPRTVQLFGEVLSLQDDGGPAGERHREQPTAAPAGRKRRDRSGSGAAAVRASRQQNKKARKVKDADNDGDRRSLTSGGGGGAGRKKLRLNATQTAMLEDSFRAHNILSHVCPCPHARSFPSRNPWLPSLMIILHIQIKFPFRFDPVCWVWNFG